MTTDDAANKLKSEHEEGLVEAKDQGWDEATEVTTEQICSLKDLIYKAGYTFGLESAGISNDHELHAKTVLCPPRTFTAAVVDPNKGTIPADEEEWGDNDGEGLQP